MKILIVDDNKISRHVLVSYAKELGYEIYQAENGDEALSIWIDVQPQIVVTDMDMPVMDGIRLAMSIREKETDHYTYIIMITALDGSNFLSDSFEAGVDDFLSKTFRKDELIYRIKAGERVVNKQEKDMIIYALATLAETRDSDTGEHIFRIQSYCKAMAYQLKLYPQFTPIITRKFITDLSTACILHDIGKIGISDEILLKPGFYTKEEKEAMKRHTIIGADSIGKIIKRSQESELLTMAKDIALYHHEWYDGSGYPFGLKNQSIPLSARIVALADVYDALTTKRVYKDAFSHQEALEIIKCNSGIQFDPEIVIAFLEIEQKFNEIKKSHSIIGF